MFFVSRNRNEHQVIFIGVQLTQRKEFRAADMIRRPDGYPDFLSRFEFPPGNDPSFYTPSHLSYLGFDGLKILYFFHGQTFPPFLFCLWVNHEKLFQNLP